MNLDDIEKAYAAIADLRPLRYSYAGVTSYADGERMVLTSDADLERGDTGSNYDQRLTRFVCVAARDVPALIARIRTLEAALKAWQHAYRSPTNELQASVLRLEADRLARAALNPTEDK